MPKNAAITMRLPAALKRRLAARAARERRSVSAQAVHELERALVDEPVARPGPSSVLGMFKGTALPNDADFAEIRAALWGRLVKRRG